MQHPQFSPQDDAIIALREYGIASLLYRHAVAAKLNLTATDMECLAALIFKGMSSPGELSQYTGLTSGATTAMLKRLEGAGLIARTPHPTDRRASVVTVTPQSKQLVGPYFAVLRGKQNDILARYSAKELATITKFVREIAEAWETERQDGVV